MLADVLRNAVDEIDELLAESPDFVGFADIVFVRDQMDRLRAKLEGGAPLNPHPSQADEPFSEVLDAAVQAFLALGRLNTELTLPRDTGLTGAEVKELEGVVAAWDQVDGKIERALEGTP